MWKEMNAHQMRKAKAVYVKQGSQPPSPAFWQRRKGRQEWEWFLVEKQEAFRYALIRDY